MLRLLSHPIFGRLFAAQVVALIGTGLLTVALGLLAYELAGAGAALVLGTAYAIKMVAYVGLAPIAGALTARLPRKPVLIGADLVRAAVVLSLPFVTEIWQIYIAIFVLQSASATFTPAFQATIPDVLPEEADYTRALSLSRLAYDLENIVSPALAGLLLALISFHWLFAGTVVGFVGSALLIRAATLPAATPTPQRPFRDRLTRGIRIYLATPRLRGLLALTLVAASISAVVIVVTVVLVRDGYGGDNRDVALALAVYGGGSMLAALALPRLLTRWADRAVMLTGSGGIIGLLTLCAVWFFAGGPDWAVFLGLWGAAGIGYSTILTPSGRLLRKSAHPDDRPALFTAQFALSHLCWLLTYPLAGWTFTTFGPAAGFLCLGTIAVMGGVAALRLWPAGDPTDLHHDHPDLPADHPHLRQHGGLGHAHSYVIDDHHRVWPTHG